MPFGRRVLVEEDLLGRLERPPFADQDRVLLPRFESGGVGIAVVEDGGRRVGLLDPADDLVIERLLQRPGVGHRGVGIGVLGVEVGDDLGVAPILQPEVVVDPSPSELLQRFRDHRRLRRHRPAGRLVAFAHPAGQ